MSLIVDVCVSAGSATAVVSAVLVAVRSSIRRHAKDMATEVVAPALEDLKKTIEDRFDKNDVDSRQAAEKAAHLELELARQFGGNSGGMRQAINEARNDIATLTGAFNQHITETNK
jgi:hypothetical protein